MADEGMDVFTWNCGTLGFVAPYRVSRFHICLCRNRNADQVKKMQEISCLLHFLLAKDTLKTCTIIMGFMNP